MSHMCLSLQSRYYKASNFPIQLVIIPDIVQDLGAAGQTKRPTSIILIKKSDIEGYEELEKEIGSLAD